MGVDRDFELRVLGGVELVRGSQAVPIGGPKPRMVLALLAIHRGSVVSTERLCQELWGDDQPADPAGVLQSHVSRLRRILRPEAEIAARPPGYVLELSDEMVDSGRFEALCAQAARASNPESIIKLLDEALNAWRGSAFDEFADFDWAAREAVRLDELRANAQEDLFDARLAVGGHAALVGELESLVAERPLRERLWGQLMIALYRSGRSAEALRRATAYRNLLREELGLEPSPPFRDLETRVLTDDPTLLHELEPAPRAAPRRLPAEATELVGRDDEIGELVRHVRGSRLVTLTGPGGVGKTRLAMRVASELWDEFDGEVFVVELASVPDPASTTAAIATAVDVRPRQHLSVEESLLEYLRTRRTMLVLDNCEHVRDALAQFAEQILGWCPQVTIVASSREVLGLPGELVWRVGPLGTPLEGCDEAAACANAAVRLFVQRANAARPGFELTPENLCDVVDIVRRVDGLPLAIELAAARVRVMSPPALAERLEKSFDLLSGAQTSMAARHRTVHDLVVWSYDLLDADEQRLFARLCVFAGGFGLDAAEAVCADEQLGASKVSMLLANLVDKSMVQLVDENVPRYRLLETLREYGSQRLADDERRLRRAQHASWYLEVVERCAQMLTGPEEPEAVAMLERDFGNLRAAHLWSIEYADVDLALRLVAGLREFAFRCMRAEAMSWADAATALPDAARHERFPVVLAVAAYDRYVRGDLDGAISLGEQALATAEQLGVDCSGLAERALGNALFFRNDTQRGLEWGDRLVASAAHRVSRAPRAHALHALRCLHQCRRQHQRRPTRGRSARGRDGVWVPDRAGSGVVRARRRARVDESGRGGRAPPAGDRRREPGGEPVDAGVRADRGAVAGGPAGTTAGGSCPVLRRDRPLVARR